MQIFYPKSKKKKKILSRSRIIGLQLWEFCASQLSLTGCPALPFNCPHNTLLETPPLIINTVITEESKVRIILLGIRNKIREDMFIFTVLISSDWITDVKAENYKPAEGSIFNSLSNSLDNVETYLLVY